MIIPEGTRIEVDARGQLSIHAPGNLVIQNSGSYGTLESVGGSIRIERAVEVEAVTVRCAETCYVQGRLTAWKVIARSLHLEESARAHVVLQETRSLEVGRDARLAGGFASETELFGLFSRFAHQVRALPLVGIAPPAELPAGEPPPGSESTVAPPPAAGELPEPLLFALVLLEREAERKIHARVSQRALDEIAKLLQEHDLETLRHTWRTLFGRIVEPREDAARAHELVAAYFTETPEPPL